MSTSKDSSSPDSPEEPAKDAKPAKGATTKGAKKSAGAAESKASKRRRGSRPQAVPGMNPSWWAPVMCALMIVGLLWIVVFYLLSNGTDDTWPIPGIGYGNLAIGFGLIMAGFMMTTRWK